MVGIPPSLIISSQDYERLTAFLRLRGFKSVTLLANKLAEASIVPATLVPPDVVTMNSIVQLMDDDSGQTLEVALVYPLGARPSESMISILSPIGVDMLGLRVGQKVDWPSAQEGSRSLRISDLLFQPEAAGAWDL